MSRTSRVAPITLVALLAACSGDAPAWVSADGWRAARCRAAAEEIADGRALDGLGEQWRQVATVFAATTDQNMELRGRASNTFGWVRRGESADRFFRDLCAPAALAEIRQRL